MEGGIRSVATAFFTICSANYLPYARTLHASLMKAMPGARLVVFLADEIDGRFDAAALPFEVVEARALECPHFWDMAARYDIVEFNTAIKPFCFQHLLKQADLDEVVYLDPDVFVISAFEELDALLAAPETSIVLTPHSTAPLDDGRNPDDVQMMKAGAYNLGFCAVRRSASADAFLTWWGARLVDNCRVAAHEALFVDQKFCDLVPAYFDGVRILRHKGYNAAYWNLASRPVTKSSAITDEASGVWRAGADPLRFFHFSGVAPGDRSVFSRHQDRFAVRDIGALRDLLYAYLDELDRFARLGAVALSSVNYAYGRFDTGVAIADVMRLVYRDVHPAAPRSREEAFGGDLDIYLLQAPQIPFDATAPVTRTMYAAWSQRADLMAAFPLQDAGARRGFLSWFTDQGAEDFELPPALVDATRALAQTRPARRGAPGFVDGRSAGEGEAPVPWGATAPGGATAARDDAVGLSMFGYFTAETGLGSAVRGNYRAAVAAGVDVVAHDIPGRKPMVVPDFSLANGAPTRDCALFHLNADETMRLASLAPLAARSARRRIGYWVWELSSFPLSWAPAFDEVDEVWTPSEFAAASIGMRTDKPVIVIPHPVAARPRTVGAAELRARLALPADRFLVLSGLDVDSFVSRKNPAAAYDAFRAAFPSDDEDVGLVIKVRRGEWRRVKEMDALLDRVAADPRVFVLDDVLSPADLSDLQHACDAFLSLHRSEGFGLWIAEMMARGKPCVVTDYGGSRDFANGEAAMAIPYDLIDLREQDYPYGDGRQWAAPRIDAAAAALRALKGDPALRSRIGASAAARIRDTLSHERIGELIARRLDQARAEAFDLPRLVVA